jgi:periplasmic copper chaperone A
MPPARLLWVLLCAGLSVPAIAAPRVEVENAWVRATAPHQTSAAAYLTLRSPEGDRLIGVGSPQAEHASLHISEHDHGFMGTEVTRMRDLPAGIPLPAGQTVTLRPGGSHIMLTELLHPLIAGQTVTLDLSFEKAGTLEILAPVEPLRADGMKRNNGMSDHGMMTQPPMAPPPAADPTNQPGAVP